LPCLPIQGYAVAQSGYATGGWAIQEAIVDTETLRRYFVAKYGKPKETYITGHSMGGFLTMMTMETNPTVYDAGMPMCGPLAAPVSFMSRGRLRRHGVVQLLLPGNFARSDEDSADFVNDRALQDKIEKALDAAPEKAAAFAPPEQSQEQ
jgi:alpha-beta hydrolase superfamily lysophospholipase